MTSRSTVLVLLVLLGVWCFVGGVLGCGERSQRGGAGDAGAPGTGGSASSGGAIGSGASASTGGVGAGGSGTGGVGRDAGADAGQDPYGRCDSGSAGAVVNSPQCPVPNSTCNAWWCSPRCPANVPSMPADAYCPMPLGGTAQTMCNFSLCYLTCRGGLVCPDGMECLGGSDCRWPAP